jgi:hypothetical protein
VDMSSEFVLPVHTYNMNQRQTKQSCNGGVQGVCNGSLDAD